MKQLIRLLGAAIVLTAAASPQAEPVQSLTAIKETVRAFLLEQSADYPSQPRIKIGHLDPRLRLAPCEEPLEAYLAPGRSAVGSTTVGVRCPGTKPWSLYVQATVQVYDQVVVAARPLGRGTTLDRGDIEVASRDIASLRGGYISEVDQILGYVVRRGVRAGTALNERLVEPPKVVRRGEPVSIIAIAGGLEVRMEGKALEDGAKGAIIRVRNTSSGRTVEGRVVRAGTVEVNI